MVKQYGILTMCQAEVEKCDLPVIDKLKVRMQLIQAKRLLLNGNVSARVRGDQNSEKEFRELYDCVKHVCRPECDAEEMEQLILRLIRIKEDLERPLKEGKPATE